jgi:hypothetical protein
LFFIGGMPDTRAEHLRYSLLFVLGRLKIQGRKGVLTDTDRQQIADGVIRQLLQYGDPWRLEEPMPEPPLAPSRNWKD